MTFDELSVLLHRDLDSEAAVVRLAELRGFGGGDRGSDLMIVAGTRQYGSVLSAELTTQLLADTSGPEPRSITTEIGDAQAVANGLACGGSVRVIVHPWSWLSAVEPHLRARRGFALVTLLDARGRPTEVRVVVHNGSGGDGAEQAAAELLRHGRVGVTLQTLGDGVVHIQCFLPRSRLVVIGTGVLAAALNAQAGLLGIETIEFDSVDAFPQVGSSDAVVVLDHDHDRVTPILHDLLLATEVPYVGSLGSRGTQAERRRRLLNCGCGDQLDRIYGPAGFDIGARSTEETAMAIVAEMLGVLRGRLGQSLRDGTGPING
ncbi:XdhC/CoxI family protein [Ferrimicrobium sp.]|uniref:XdhC family protein n=1 Tax=Ferrimicrobium sp. TaxID=2926050 RepID=UPI0026371DB2|nr:XdhC/CoxI family protein [Ferrimicrobium sp.]